jgi:hypothetical protein
VQFGEPVVGRVVLARERDGVLPEVRHPLGDGGVLLEPVPFELLETRAAGAVQADDYLDHRGVKDGSRS